MCLCLCLCAPRHDNLQKKPPDEWEIVIRSLNFSVCALNEHERIRLSMCCMEKKVVAHRCRRHRCRHSLRPCHSSIATSRTGSKVLDANCAIAWLPFFPFFAFRMYIVLAQSVQHGEMCCTCMRRLSVYIIIIISNVDYLWQRNRFTEQERRNEIFCFYRNFASSAFVQGNKSFCVVPSNNTLSKLNSFYAIKPLSLTAKSIVNGWWHGIACIR